ncbi:MAG: preprotein translocase subunit YajC [Myxococcota bacterium]|jgi:preprotein translocase subunit YajC
MTWLLPTLIVASIGGVTPAIDLMMPAIPIVLAQDNVPTKGGAGGSEPAAPTATAQSGDSGAAQGSQSEGGGWQMMLIMGLIFGFFWLFFIRPQNKQMKEHKALIENLKKGDQIVTQGGVLGRISGFDESVGAVIVEIAQNVRVKVVRSQIARMQGSDKVAETDSGKSKELKSKSAKSGTAKAGK